MRKYDLREAGEYKPGSSNSINLNRLKEFVTVPYYIEWYKSKNSHKIHPLFIQEVEYLNPTSANIPGVISRNPFFDHAQIKFFIAYGDEKPVGRIIAFINYNYNRKYEDNVGWFGLFESIEDRQVAEMLIDAAIGYLKANGCKKAIGPAKFNAAGEVGLLISGFENRPYFMEPYNAPYYKDFFEGYGLARKNDWYSVVTDEIISRKYMERIERVLDKFENRKPVAHNSIKIREVNFRDYKNEMEKIKELYNDLWESENHPQQVRLTDGEFNYLAMGIKAVSMEGMVFMIEKEGRPIGLSVNTPDINEVIEAFDRKWPYMPSRRFFSMRDFSRDIKIYNQIKRKIKTKGFTRLRVLLLGVKKEHRKAGIESRVFYKIGKSAVNHGFKYASGSQLADINLDIINPIFRLGNVAFTWRVYNTDI
jgi:GNAT superfamily N-acetyltransferase